MTENSVLSYDHMPEFYFRVADMLADGDIDTLRAQIEEDLWLSGQLGLLPGALGPQRPPGEPPKHFQLHRDAGLDLAEMEAHAHSDGTRLLAKMLKNRTGEALVQPPSLDTLIEDARRKLH